ncbi:hypothetical protein ISF_09520 [Cordyceps fumosorosea ARSEF 2679]|uniref:Uncharacterized protein n=1 Tax=Cordyceps fumosorosea (strain ARSEF 2679) TaxID=1081104 RepID=A0A162JQA5_CORFA|nr:hypothetical protein ISF_09520 [Cordyceps fumosorosea ARSEF 2679]OAA47528.1 hypothetical protein ISF_09520 [Cordyceps fumosorosea ARSEF 2679]
MGDLLAFVRSGSLHRHIVIGKAVSMTIVGTGHWRRLVRPALFAVAAILAVGIAGTSVIVVVIVLAIITTVAIAAAVAVGIAGRAVTVAIISDVAVAIDRG